MIRVRWKKGFASLHNGADAQKVYDEILAIGPSATPEQILERGRETDGELHKCFTWDDRAAAERWRHHEARQIVCHLVLDREEDTPEEPEVRVLFKCGPEDGYQPATVVFRQESQYRMMLNRALGELNAFTRKYQILSDLEEMRTLINAVDQMIQSA